MKNVSSINIDLENFSNKLIQELINKQRDTAYAIQQDAKSIAPSDTGKYAETIKVSETIYDGNTIRTSIYTDATVTALASGNIYNLGQLLEEGTSPHEIRAVNAGGLFWGAYDDNGNPVIVKSVQHPGTISQPHFIPALNKNVALYKSNIAKAIKEAK